MISRSFETVTSFPKYFHTCCHCPVPQSFPTLCNLMDHSMPGLSVPHHLLKLLEFMSIASVMLSSQLILWFLLFLLPSIVLASGTYPISQLFASDDQNTEVSASASVLPMNIQGWFPLRLIGLISLMSKELSRVFSSTTVKRCQFFSAPLSLWSSSQNHTWLLGRPLSWVLGPLSEE